MKFTLPFIAAAIAVTFASCTKEPTACFTFSNTNPEVFDVVTFNNCSEEAESYDWVINTDFFQQSSSDDNPQFAWDETGTYSVELEVASGNGKKTDVTSNSITVTDYCYECEYEIFGVITSSDLCASDYFSKDDFDDAIDSYEDSGYDCDKK